MILVRKEGPGPGGRQRIDKWLWHARVGKTRSLVQKLVLSGHVRLNGTRITASSQAVKTGDVLTIALENHVRILEVKGFSERRGSAPAAALLYGDLSPPPVPAEPKPPSGLSREKGAGRPTKRDLRAINLIRGRD
ncbi:RNA-binding protein S4 [Terrihabitans soli]|uniref:RNA-binding protein S4 n=1 Tax=Terrihabitans soli TaxID=708113 RepID=A0A6S6QK21_9HYPH|nr:RNA-binding S4 domain-containing protein [Terrihabitans soli]BCJ89586.1 RNA-binding protein S4 [Terrihabitans soli]